MITFAPGYRHLGLALVAVSVAVGACSSEEATENTTTNNRGGSKGGTAGSAGAQAAAGKSGSSTAGSAGAAGSDTAGSSGSTAAGGTGGAGGGGSLVTACPGGMDAECNDGNPCTADRCASNACVFSLVLPGTACDVDDDKCNGVGTCEGAVCKPDPATKIDASDADLCTEDLCDPKSGTVTHVSKVKPNDSTPCTAASCDPATGQIVTRDLSIDGNPCTYDECDLSSGPINTPKPLGDGNPCTADSCDPVTGTIVHKLIAGCSKCTTDAACDDGNPCTNDVCKNDICESIIAPEGASCDNGNACDGVATCKKGICKVGPAPTIDDDDICTKDSCDPNTGQVTHTQIPKCQQP